MKAFDVAETIRRLPLRRPSDLWPVRIAGRHTLRPHRALQAEACGPAAVAKRRPAARDNSASDDRQPFRTHIRRSRSSPATRAIPRRPDHSKFHGRNRRPKGTRRQNSGMGVSQGNHGTFAAFGPEKNRLFTGRSPVATSTLAARMYQKSSEELTQTVEIDGLGDASITTCIPDAFYVPQRHARSDSTIGRCARCFCLRAQ